MNECGRDLQETIKISKNSAVKLELERNKCGGKVLYLKVKRCVTCTYGRLGNKLLETAEKI